MKDDLNALYAEFQEAVKKISTSDELEELRRVFIGRKGKLPAILKGLPGLAEDLRKEMGAFANEVKGQVETLFEEVSREIIGAEKKGAEEENWIDITAPAIPPSLGHTHLTSQAIEEITQIFESIGFTQGVHPEIDWDWYAFESLNLPKNHPARDEWETFFVADGDKIMEGEKGKVVLTPHTSNAQVRQMEMQKPPIRLINIGKTYRRQASVRHLPMFHQFEGLVIDKTASIAELKGVIDYFVKAYFGEDRETRLRPHHFRFTEPSFEVDISAEKGREGEKLFKAGWLELGGAGIVHPNVIASAGLDPNEYTGFAFGFGIERTMMMKSGLNIPDIRITYKNDLNFLQQF